MQMYFRDRILERRRDNFRESEFDKILAIWIFFTQEFEIFKLNCSTRRTWKVSRNQSVIIVRIKICKVQEIYQVYSFSNYYHGRNICLDAKKIDKFRARN